LSFVRAYKVLVDGRSAFSGWHWPQPEGDEPGEWVHASASEPLGLCVNGVHACTIEQLAQWLGEEVWTIELGGAILETDAALVAERGRLLHPLRGWDEIARKAFAADCVVRATPRAAAFDNGAQLLAFVEDLAAAGRAGPAGYWAAVIAGERVAGRRRGPKYDAEFANERAAQAQWLAAALGD
jgi:hypothetical protein